MSQVIHARTLPEPPKQPGCLGEQLTALARSLQLATENGTSAKDEWDCARIEAAQHWRQSK
jgi:hypothetical protein